MKKEEVLTLLERFPELVDSDDLIQDLYREASGESGDEAGPARPPLSKPVGLTDSPDAPKHPR